MKLENAGITRAVFVMVATTVLLSTSACMVTPYDQQRVDSKISEISFNGGYPVSGSEIAIESLDSSSQTWSQIEGASTLPFTFSTPFGTSLYAWTKRVVIPEQFWEPGVFGHRAQVRATAGDVNLISVQQDINTCWYQHRSSLGAFIANCSAPGSPVARVYTQDYVDVDAGCTPEAQRLIELVNDERELAGLSRIPMSPSLCTVGQVHAMDLEINRPHNAEAECNMHSWSDQGDWSSCCYTVDEDGNHPQASCMWSKPKELTDYPGIGYENATTSGDAESAWENFRHSTPHWNVIMNRSIWDDNTWRAIGAGFYGGFALLWFGEDTDPASP